MNSQMFVVLFLVICLLEKGVLSLLEKKKETYANGDRYDGYMDDGRKSGIGKYVWSSLNNSYDGEWSYDQMHGQGIFKYGDGAIYDGEWFDNERHGWGIYRSGNGKCQAFISKAI